MKPETFFEKFDQFAESPNAVAKLRELVLELAVKGKLVKQDPNDEPAQALLERTASTANTRRRGADDIDDTDAPFPIPVTWA